MTNGFTKRKVGTLTLGEKLKKMRSDKRIALNEVSRVTKIRLEYLQFLEEGSYDELPADVYVRGFLKSYGDFLGVEEQYLVKLFEKEKGIKKNLEKNKNPDKNKNDAQAKPLNISAFVFTFKKVVLFFIAILTLIVFFYLYHEAGMLTDTPRLIILNPEPNSQVEEKSISLEGKTDKDAQIFINDQLVLVDDGGKFKEAISLQSGINVIRVKAVNKFKKEAVENITVQANYAEDSLEVANAENPVENLAEQNNFLADDTAVQVELNVDPGPVWVSVETDSNLVFSGTVLAGDVQKFNARDKIVISSGQASATYIKLNGADKGALGKEAGAIKGVVFVKEEKKQ